MPLRSKTPVPDSQHLADRGHAEHHLLAQYAVVEALARSSTLEEAAPLVLRAVADAVGWKVGVLWIVDKNANDLRCVDVWHADGFDARAFEDETRHSRFSYGVGPGRIWEMGHAAWLIDVTKEERFSRRATAQLAGLHAAFSFPMVLAGGVVGVVEFFTDAALKSSDATLRLFAAVGTQLGAFIGRTRAQEQIERFFTMSRDLLCIAAFDGYFKRVNEAWEHVLGHSPADLLAHPHLDFVHLDDRAMTAQQWDTLRGGGAATFENRWRCRDGSYKWLFWNAVSKPEEEGVYAVARDDTVRHATEHQLQETLRMRNDFVSFVTHQLRTPLSGIKWMLELATEAEDPAEITSYIQDARESAERLIRLVNDLLDASRLEGGKLQIVLAPVQLREVTEHVLADVASLVREKGHALVVEASPTPEAMLDLQLLRQVIMNLVSNAIKYTPHGGRIVITIGHDRDGLHWSIRDSGIGIPKAGQARLFQKFYRAENGLTVDTEGTGLGLYLVRLIVERFGGTIRCESEQDQGTVFHFTLPLGPGLAP